MIDDRLNFNSHVEYAYERAAKQVQRYRQDLAEPRDDEEPTEVEQYVNGHASRKFVSGYIYGSSVRYRRDDVNQYHAGGGQLMQRRKVDGHTA